MFGDIGVRDEIDFWWARACFPDKTGRRSQSPASAEGAKPTGRRSGGPPPENFEKREWH